MPRISRNKVEFDVNGEKWIAAFEHMHAKTVVAKGGKVIVKPVATTTGLKLKHVTVCNLYRLNSTGEPEGHGVAHCSVRDEYNWRKGVKMAFSRALDSMTKDVLHLKEDAAQKVREHWVYGPLSKPFVHSFFVEMSKRVEPEAEGTLMKTVGEAIAANIVGRVHVHPIAAVMSGVPDGFVPLTTKDGINLLVPKSDRRAVDPMGAVL